MMVLVEIPWVGHVWGLPFLSTLCPSEQYYKKKKQEHKKITIWARQMIKLMSRWLPDKKVIIVGDSAFSALDLLWAASTHGINLVTRLRLDAALYEPAPPRPRNPKAGRPRRKGVRLPTLNSVLKDSTKKWKQVTLPHWYAHEYKTVEVLSETAVWFHKGLNPVPIRWVLVRDPEGKVKPQAFLATDLTPTPEQILHWYIKRWGIEVTFEETKAHLGFETQRQWSDKAIARTTPAILGMFSIVTLLANRLQKKRRLRSNAAKWYNKQHPTFSDALATVRFYLWNFKHFAISSRNTDTIQIPRALYVRLTETLAYAA